MELGSEGYAVARTIKSVRAFVPAMFVRGPGQHSLAPPLCARFLACNALYLAWLGHAVLVRSWEEGHACFTCTLRHPGNGFSVITICEEDFTGFYRH